MSEWLERKVVSVKESGIEEVQIAKCPYCQRYHTTPYMYYFKEYPFCPNCGCRIVEKETHHYSPEEVAELFMKSVSAVEDTEADEEPEDCEEDETKKIVEKGSVVVPETEYECNL